jgi:hypothetical protein
MPGDPDAFDWDAWTNGYDDELADDLVPMRPDDPEYMTAYELGRSSAYHEHEDAE